MKTEKHKAKLTQVIRIVLQIVFFIFLPTLYYSAFNGIKQTFLAIIHQSFSSALIPQLIEAIAIIPITILLGRFFCGWMCAFGSMGDFIYIISKKLFKINFRMNEKADAVLKYAKYVWLLVLVIIWGIGSSVFAAANPWDVFGMIATVGKFPAISYVVTNVTLGFFLFCLIVVGSAFVERFFCRFFCPLGAVFAIVSRLKITRISKSTEKCGKCRICTNNCSMGIPLYKSGLVRSGECINCMKCVSSCPRHNVTFTVYGGSLRPLVASTVTVAAMTGAYYFGNLTSSSALINTTATTSQVESEAASSNASGSTSASSATKASSATSSKASSTTSSKAASTTPSKAASSSSPKATSTNKLYKDGMYQGDGTGFRGGTTTVSVTVKNDKITAVNAISTNDDGQFFNTAFSAITNEIISLQSAKVDAVSGATYSSNGIMEAVANALAKAKT